MSEYVIRYVIVYHHISIYFLSQFLAIFIATLRPMNENKALDSVATQDFF